MVQLSKQQLTGHASGERAKRRRQIEPLLCLIKMKEKKVAMA